MILLVIFTLALGLWLVFFPAKHKHRGKLDFLGVALILLGLMLGILRWA